jgi:hypothetical protein
MATTIPSPRTRRILRRLLVTTVVAAVLVVSLVLIFAGAGHSAAGHRPVVTGGTVRPFTGGTVNSGPDNPDNQPAHQVFGG